MTGQDEQERLDSWQGLGIRTEVAHPARVYDYLLGGKDNFAADRELAEANLRILPQTLDSARANRKFQVRAVRFLRDSGIRQFLDVGTGLPTSPNTHEIALDGCPGARVVYVDDNPVVFVHAEALMADNQATSVVRGDLRDADAVLSAAGERSALGDCFADGGHDFVCPEVQRRVADAVARREQVDESGGAVFEHGEGQFLYPLRHSAPDPAALVVAGLGSGSRVRRPDTL